MMRAALRDDPRLRRFSLFPAYPWRTTSAGELEQVNLTLAPKVWLFVDGNWEDVSSYVLYEEALEIERGRQGESDSIDYDKCRLTFLNDDKRFTPRHPESPWFDLLGRNTPIRVSRGNIDYTEENYLYLPGTTGSYVSCVDSSGLSITGDIEIVIDVALDSWREAQDLCSKYRVDGNDRSWALNIDDDGFLQWVWSADGTNTSNAFSTIPVPDPGDGGRLAIRVDFDVNNGAAGNNTTFWICAQNANISNNLAPWQQLGAKVTNSGTTSIFDSDAKVVVGDIPTSGNAPLAGKLYQFVCKSGIAGANRARAEFTNQDEETSSFTDAAGNIFILSGAAQFVQKVKGPFRFHGEVSEWPVESDISGEFVTVSIEASGIWRRLSQNEEPTHSAMFRAHTHPSLTRVKACWSMEDGAEATEIASNWAQGTGFPMLITGSPSLSSYDGWTASDALPNMNGASFRGRVTRYTNTTGTASVYMFGFVGTAVAAETSLMYIETTGTARFFDLRLLPNGNMRIKAYADDASAIDDGAGNLDAELGFDINSRGFLIVGLHLVQTGANIQWFFTINDFTNTDVAAGGITALFFSGTITSKTFGSINFVTIGQEFGLADFTAGHLAVSDEVTTKLYDVGDAVNAHNGENPATRLLRLCGENQIPIEIASGSGIFPANSVTLGDQTSKSFSDLLQEAESTDLGILHESRDRFALRYRTRLSLANQTPAFTLSHASHQLAATLKPLDDDQRLVNDQYVVRDKGIKAYRSKNEGKLSTLKPKSGGVGRYPDEKRISLTYDDQVDDQAGFRLRVGTFDGARYPQIIINLHHPSIANDPDLLAAILSADIGDRIVVTDMPDYLPPDDVNVLIHGYSERFDQFTHQITFNCIPAEPWDWSIADDLTKRVGPTAAETSGSFVSGTDTSLTVVTTEGPVAIDSTTYPSEFPFYITVSGVVLEVTAVSGTTSPQTFTITQTPINGVAKTISSGSSIQVTHLAYVGMI